MASERQGNRLHLMLAAYGVASALLAGVILWALAPDPWLLQGSRVTELGSALDAREAGEPPLVGLWRGSGGEPVRYAVGTTDDQGIYVAAPYLSDTFGLGATDGVKLLWVILFSLAIAGAPLIYYGLFRSIAAATAAPIALLLGVLALRLGAELSERGDDIYWVSAWAVMALIPPLLLLDLRRPRGWFAWLLVIVVIASFASSIRSSSGLPVAIAAALVVIATGAPWWKRGVGLLAIALATISISTAALAVAREYRDDQVGAGELGRGEPTAHPFWHPAYLGLGYLPNDEEIYFRDDIAHAHAEEESPGVRYLSTEYEHTLRTLALELARSEPLFTVGTVAQKLVVVVKQTAIFFVLLALLLPGFLLLSDRRRDHRRMALLVAPAVAIGLISPLLAIPIFDYELGLIGGLLVLIMLGVLWIVAGAAREWASAMLGRPSGRRALAWSAGSLAVIAICFALGTQIEERAADWLAGAPPPPSQTAPAPR
jgi:hypothetical protein